MLKFICNSGMRAKQSELLTTTHGKSAASIVARGIISCQANRKSCTSKGPAANSRIRFAGQLNQELVKLGVSRQQFVAQIDGFSLAALNNTPHRTPGEMGWRDLRLIEAMYRSADAGGQVVKV